MTTQPAQLTPSEPEPLSEPVDGTTYESAAHLTMPDPASRMAFIALPPSSSTLTVDVGRDFGGESSGPEPKELLLVALGSCTGVDVISILRKKRQQITHYSINVYANEAKEHPRVYTDILVEHVLGGDNVDPRAVARSIELSISKYCPVHAMLSAATHITHVYRVLGGQ